MLIWEDVPQSTSGMLQRCKIPMGWLVKEVQNVHVNIGIGNPVLDNYGYEWTSSITFIPDPHHEWEIETNK